MENIRQSINSRRKKAIVYPESSDIFNAFKLCPWEDVRVVIVGQDPYHTPGYAHGLAFSSLNPHPLPPSLRNILKELEEDLGFDINTYERFDLTPWAEQGVLLINTALTVEKGDPNCHSDLWKPFTEEVFKVLKEKTGVVYVLWGAHARSYKKFIDLDRNYVIESAHPSPLSASKGFFGSKPFSKVNEILEGLNGPEFKINWQYELRE